MSRWTVNAVTNQTCPLRRIVAVGDPRPSSAPGSVHPDWIDETLDCGHVHVTYAVRRKPVGSRRRCLACRDAGGDAPGLLEALETMRAWAIPGMDWTDDIGREILAAVDAAIAKAKKSNRWPAR